jgi:hypothetical protein
VIRFEVRVYEACPARWAGRGRPVLAYSYTRWIDEPERRDRLQLQRDREDIAILLDKTHRRH